MRLCQGQPGTRDLYISVYVISLQTGMILDFAIVQSSISKSFPPSEILIVDLELLRELGVSQAFAMISVKPLCLQQQEPLMINVAPSLDNFSEQRISLPLARAQKRENKVKEGIVMTI